MAKANLNVFPYFDDFNEDKNFYRILFRPGVAVQARELTQIQSLLQNQISSIGNYLFKDGSRVPSIETSTISINENARAIRLEEFVNSVEIDVNNYLNLWVTGATSDIVGEVKFVYAKDNPTVGDPPTIVISLTGGKFTPDNRGFFQPEELLYFFDNRSDAVNKRTSTALYTALTAPNSTFNANGTLLQGSDEITFAVGNTEVKPGDEVTATGLAETLFVVASETNNRISLSGVSGSTLQNVNFTFTRRNTTPTLIVTVDSGIYYKYGIFIKSTQQSIVPDKYNAYPSKALTLKYEETIVTSEDDSSLLDPAVGSSNYFAPGADRFKIFLRLQSLELDEANKADAESEFIEVMRFVEGRRYIFNATQDATGLRAELAKRTFDESGNYVVEGFDIDTIQVATNNANIKLSIGPGTAYVGGYDVTTISPTFLELPKARVTKTDISFNVNTNYGNYIIVNAPTAGLLNETKPDALAIVEVHSVVNPASNDSLIGYMYFKHLEYNDGAGSDATFRLYYYYYFPAGSGAVPLSWLGFGSRYDIPVNEAQFVSSSLYETNSLLATVGAQDVYGPFREPDSTNLAYWWGVWKTNGEDMNIVKPLFAAAMLSSTDYDDNTRVLTANKTFLSTDNNSPFIDDVFTGNIGLEFARSVVLIDNAFSPSGFTYANPGFKAIVAGIGIDENDRLINYRATDDNMIFSIGRSYIKTLDRISMQYSKTLFEQQFINGRATISLSGNESFAAADGIMSGPLARDNFIVIANNQNPGTPLSWAEFSTKYNIPVDEAQSIALALYGTNDQIATLADSTVIYGPFREPDIAGLVFWWTQWKNRGENISNILGDFALAIYQSDPNRSTTQDKTYLESDNNSPFFDTEYLDENLTGRAYVPLDTLATVTITNNSQTATIQLTDTSYNGLGDITFIVDNDDTSIRTKTYNSGGGYINNIQETDIDYRIPYADIAKFHGVYIVNQNDSYIGEWSNAVTYQVNNIVYYNNKVYRALAANNNVLPTTAASWEELTSEDLLYYYLDDGQTENLYNFGAVRWIGDADLTPGRTLVVFDYYTHTGTGPLTVDSYPNYDTIPVFLSQRNGQSFSLRDCLDFRPIRVNNITTSVQVSESIKPNPQFLTELDVEYYIGRKDRIYITNKETNPTNPGERFYVDRGISEVNPKTPREIEDSNQMLLFDVHLPPYTENSDKVSIISAKNNRYTMEDIGDIDDRLNLLEKRVRRQGLEIIALNDVITNPDGKELYKSGIFIDDFETRQQANIYSPSFRAWIDVEKQECKPTVVYNTIEYATVNSDSFAEYDNLVYLPFVQESFISQKSFNTYTNPNPGGVPIDPITKITPHSTAEPGTENAGCQDIELLRTVLGKNFDLGGYGITCDKGGVLGIDGSALGLAGDQVSSIAEELRDIAQGIRDQDADAVSNLARTLDTLRRQSQLAGRESGDWLD